MLHYLRPRREKIFGPAPSQAAALFDLGHYPLVGRIEPLPQIANRFRLLGNACMQALDFPR